MQDQITSGKRKRRESGSTMVEFAFVITILLAFVMLYINLVWTLFTWACVQESIREGVRAAVTCTPSTGLTAAIESSIETYSFGFINSSNVGTVVSIQYLDPTTLSPVTTSTVNTGDVVKITISNLKVTLFAPLLVPKASPIYVGAVSADVMACATAATP